MQTTDATSQSGVSVFGILSAIGQVVLLGLMASYVLLIVIPYYGSGMHILSVGDIWEINNTNRNLVEWHFLFDDEGLIRWSGGLFWAQSCWLLYVCIGMPLFLALSVASATRWTAMSIWPKVIAIASAIMFLTLFSVCVASWRGVMAWLFD